MAARMCPLCSTKVPAGCVVAHTDGMDCPGCKARLEVSFGSRFLATTAGLLVGALVCRWTPATAGAAGLLGWVKPMLFAFLAFSFATPLVLIFIADLRVRTAEVPAEPVALPHAGSHGDHQ